MILSLLVFYSCDKEFNTLEIHQVERNDNFNIEQRNNNETISKRIVIQGKLHRALYACSFKFGLCGFTICNDEVPGDCPDYLVHGEIESGHQILYFQEEVPHMEDEFIIDETISFPFWDNDSYIYEDIIPGTYVIEYEGDDYSDSIGESIARVRLN